MWPFRQRKVNLPASDLAETLLSEIVANEETKPRLYRNLEDQQEKVFVSKCKLYRLAIVILVLTAEEARNPKARQVRQHIEAKISRNGPKKAESFLSDLRKAVEDLANLIAATLSDGPPRQFSWARSWFENQVGIDEINPAELWLFAHYWELTYVMVTKAVRDFRIT